ncbi:hypothetical protein ABBQ32_008799 [Trebouxia sp. C0010 RCD-2024]
MLALTPQVAVEAYHHSQQTQKQSSRGRVLKQSLRCVCPQPYALAQQLPQQAQQLPLQPQQLLPLPQQPLQQVQQLSQQAQQLLQPLPVLQQAQQLLQPLPLPQQAQQLPQQGLPVCTADSANQAVAGELAQTLAGQIDAVQLRKGPFPELKTFQSIVQLNKLQHMATT